MTKQNTSIQSDTSLAAKDSIQYELQTKLLQINAITHSLTNYGDDMDSDHRGILIELLTDLSNDSVTLFAQLVK